MKKEKLSFAFKVLIMSISMIIICAIIIVPTIKFSGDPSGSSVHVNKNYETNAGSTDISKPSNDNNQTLENASTVEFFINEQTVSKTKKIVGEITMFTLNLKVFVNNETDSSKTIHTSAFEGSYDIGEYASFYKLECKEETSSKVISAGECDSFELEFVYVVTDTENFKPHLKYDLTVNYMSAEVISANI
ncbi:MAG: hypothetical protein IJA23_04775 [Clostridia bacterium]|nr:hypothetical protein [Clostridia bacterium]